MSYIYFHRIGITCSTPTYREETCDCDNFNLFTTVKSACDTLNFRAIKCMMTHTCKLTLSYVKALPKYITITYGIILVVWYVLQLRPHNMYIHIHRKTKFHFTGQNLTLVKNICEVTWLPVLPLPTELASILFTVQQSCRI